jgi:histone acetyltransferase 1
MAVNGSCSLSIAGNKYDSYKASANDVIHFKLVRRQSDIADDNNVFKPDMTHQLFGDSESIFGYKDLRVNIYYTAGNMITYMNMTYSDKLSATHTLDQVNADDVLRTIGSKLEPGYLTNIDEFSTAIDTDATFIPHGQLIDSYTTTKVGEVDRRFEIYFVDSPTPVGFLDYHKRLQPFLLFYVDAASYIDVDDDKWNYYVIYEKYPVDGSFRFAFVGYMTVYNYFAYPECIRPRISQVLVLPPFQRQGHCARLIQCFYNRCYTQTQVVDVTVEDPSEGFQRVRDFVDCKNCSKLTSFAADKLRLGYSDEMEHDARNKLKLNKRQSRRVYEILRLRVTDCMNKHELKNYRLDVKRRLNIPFQKNSRDFRKLERALNATELSATLNSLSREQRMETLERQFQLCLNDYRQIIERLAIDC